MTAKRSDAAYEVIPGPGRAPAPSMPVEPPVDPGDGEPTLGDYVATILEYRWLVAALAAAVLALGAAYAVLAPRTWHTDVLLQVEDQKAGMAGLDDISTMFGEATPADTEIEILRSRMIVGAVVDELRLYITAQPRRFPVIGGAIARRHGADDEPAAPVLGMARFGWGGERIQVTRLEVPRDLLGETLTLVAGDQGRYELLDPDGERLLSGEVGKAASGGGVDTFVQVLRARPGTQFRLVRRSREDAIADLQQDLRIGEKGKKTGIIQVSLEGRDRERIAATLDALSSHYVRQNVERRSADAEKSLEFIEGQIPDLRARLDTAERALQEYQTEHGQVDLSIETKATVDLAGDVEKQLTELQLERAALRERFTEQHPAVVAVDRKIAQLMSQRRSVEDRMRQLPESELESARRMRDVKVSTDMYMALLNKAQELKVVKSGTLGNVRVLDSAILPGKPVAPKVPAVLALSLLLGLGLGVAAAFARRALDSGVEDPDAIERALRLPIYAAVPTSDRQAELERAHRRGERMPPLAGVDPKDLTVESLRSLRTGLQFALVESGNNVLMISGPAPSIGKSFISSNLAHLIGEAGQKVLVIDADLRRGRLHKVFGGTRDRGVSEVIGGTVPLQFAVRPTDSSNVFFLPTGVIPPNPSELVASERFAAMVEEASKQYDLVIVDTPPVLAVTDAVLAARTAGVALFVLRAGKHPMREVEAAVRQFTRNGLRVSGFVLNQVSLRRGVGKASAYHYQYRYE